MTCKLLLESWAPFLPTRCLDRPNLSKLAKLPTRGGKEGGNLLCNTQHRHWQSCLAKRDGVTALFVSITFIIPFHARLSCVQHTQPVKVTNSLPPPGSPKYEPLTFQFLLWFVKWDRGDTNIKITMISPVQSYWVWAHVVRVCWIFWGLMVAVFVRSPPAPSSVVVAVGNWEQLWMGAPRLLPFAQSPL